MQCYVAFLLRGVVYAYGTERVLLLIVYYIILEPQFWLILLWYCKLYLFHSVFKLHMYLS